MPDSRSPGRNHPNSHKRNRLTRNGRRLGSHPTRSAPESNGERPPKASSPALRRLFASATRAAAQVVAGGFEDVAADVDELVGPFGRVSVDVGVGAVQASAAAPPAGLGTQASSGSGAGSAASASDIERVRRPVSALAAANRARAFTPPPGDLAAGG